MPKTGITAHMVVKNEDQWVRYAIQSVLPYVDKFLITDTGSTDQTVDVIKSIKSDKLLFNQVKASKATEITRIRQSQLASTQTPWIWVVDGDEIYTDSCAQEVAKVVKTNKYDIILVRRYDLLGDIYHRQKESVGTYNLFGQSGHLLIRLVNKNKVKGLDYQGDYPLEGYFYDQGKNILSYNPDLVYTTKFHLYHAMYLKRSSKGANIVGMFNRSKYKIEKGVVINDTLPEVFDSPLQKRNLLYELLASIITPIKDIKRKLL